MNVELRELSIKEKEQIKQFFYNVFTKEPWNDDWSNERQLDAYITDLIGNLSSLTFGLFEKETMVGLAMGCIRHWYSGTEYQIDEFCVKTEEQGRGLGTYFLKEIETYIKEKGIQQIMLQTERDVPAYEFYKKNGFFELKDHVTFIKE